MYQSRAILDNLIRTKISMHKRLNDDVQHSKLCRDSFVIHSLKTTRNVAKTMKYLKHLPSERIKYYENLKLYYEWRWKFYRNKIKETVTFFKIVYFSYITLQINKKMMWWRCCGKEDVPNQRKSTYLVKANQRIVTKSARVKHL